MKVSDDVVKEMEKSADALDAVVCLLAARDFLVGEAMPPVDRNLAEIEGWIWTRDPAKLENGSAGLQPIEKDMSPE